MSILLSARRIGEFTLDATTSEEHTSELTITDSPVESGATISDHAVIKPKQVTITGYIVGYEPVITAISSGDKDDLLLDGAKRLATCIPQIPGGIPTLKDTANNIAKDFKLDLQGTSDPNAFLKQFSLPVLGASNDRVSKYHQMILELQQKAIPLDVSTGTILYKNMLIESVGVSQEKDFSAKFTIGLRQVIIVDTLSVKLKKSSPHKKGKGAGRAKGKGADIKKEQPKKSFVKWLVS